ncbi:MAG: Hpy99I family type II restriction endonuclease [Bacteroidales bacterium]|nr:Hpy99I family type II restriction endonuclease [Bacteroidales bacterium]
MKIENKLNHNDFVILLNNKDGIVKNSVGIIKKIEENYVKVFFIGKKKTLLVKNNDIQLIDIYKTGKPYDVKICNVCHILKPNSDFEINQTDAKGRKTTRPSCRECRKDINGIGLNNEDSKRMDKEKPSGIFTCPICKKTSIVGVTANLVKDHDHKTGKGRAWICDSCNTGLGRFKDDVNLLQEAIKYLKSFE